MIRNRLLFMRLKHAAGCFCNLRPGSGLVGSLPTRVGLSPSFPVVLYRVILLSCLCAVLFAEILAGSPS